MPEDLLKISYTSALILKTIQAGHCYGFEIMDATGLPSGTVYPALRRLERADVIRSEWERESVAQAEQRPARKYYKLTRSGHAVLTTASDRYRLPQFAGAKKEGQ
jgi:PadR family transcriptional regulator PadR